MKLHELHESTGMLTTKEEVAAWCKQHNIRNAVVNDDLTVSAPSSINPVTFKGAYLPVKFREIKDFAFIPDSLITLEGLSADTINGIDCSSGSSNLQSLKGCPREVRSDFIINNCYHLKSLKFGPKIVGGNYLARYIPLDDLNRIAEEIGRNLYLTIFDMNFPILDILKIRKLQKVVLNGSLDRFEKLAPQLAAILNRWLEEPYGNKRIIGCQSFLIDVGLESFAQFGDY
jgi:hypothetical protein